MSTTRRGFLRSLGIGAAATGIGLQIQPSSSVQAQPSAGGGFITPDQVRASEGFQEFEEKMLYGQNGFPVMVVRGSKRDPRIS